ncbi:DNA adenine methylase [Luteolibacter flavescens]|uniref:site-specific DNA-methyltransferase (adenine-specific) n=1 Tax=Luteolibacter flavescens TaxID=1859460 RepID=A0ABT3FKB1_9BACT|nr:DNA adenine methylase [Luteolibacter flavescens]MCW1884013.1 DNA adenine methylase [Luteolibacter flavescens]
MTPDINCSALPDEDLAILLETLASVVRTPAPPVPGSPKPVVAWQGGKRWLVKELLPLIPEHKMYVELFCGGGALLCAKKPSQAEVVNDADSELVNLYRIVKWHLEELMRELDWCLNSRQEFADFKAQRGLTDIQRAARWMMRMKNGFGGAPDYFGRSRNGAGAAFSSKAGKLALLRAMNRRLDKVVIENLDWKDCIRLYDQKPAVFFCDPPYTTGEARYGAWTIDDLARFREEGLDQLKGTWILTIDDTPANRLLFRDCLIKPVSRKNGIGHAADGSTSVYHELIIRPDDGRHKP